MLDPQRRAADPARSVFVTANAGSGKTKTLIDRVARLLLSQARPEAVLCVTYTKAAAAEMQRRLFQRLGAWSVMADEELRDELTALQGEGLYDEEALSRARALFARALEAPGGLKIQTIHAFCEKLLRRFPIEAQVSPGFTVMDDAAAAAIVSEARAAVAAHALHHSDVVADAYARMSVALDYGAFQDMFRCFEDRRGALGAYLERCGGLGGAVADVWKTCGFGQPSDPQAIEEAAMAGVDRELWLAAAEVLARGGKADAKCAEQLAAVANDGAAGFNAALAVLFTDKGKGTPAIWVARTSGLKTREDLRERLLEEQAMLGHARERVRSARVAQDTAYVLALASAYVAAYRIEKESRRALDFADLIERTRLLLTERADAAWVLYKLDGGIDHILVDEAQDTAPEQWDILSELTAEFFAADGRSRTLFVVGDEKQSIYSFQGAAPERLLAETQRYLTVIGDAGMAGEGVSLSVSYRSTPQVLGYVDAVFFPPETRRGVPPPAGLDVVSHAAHRANHEGCVDLWPLEREVAGAEREAWDAPLDMAAQDSANRRLARKIAAEIEALAARGDAVFDKERRQWRPASYGDVIVLVRRRKALFEEILRELKRRAIPVAGADRLALSEHIAFDDLVAVARFVLFPGDDLTLAALLKAPFFSIDDESLYALAHGREASLWRTLKRRGGERAEWAEACALLERLRREAREQAPFEFYARLLGARDSTGRSMRARMLTRLGAEASDAIEEFLAQVLAAEQRGVRDLESLTQAFASLDITVKREMEGERGEVRVMTAHGAKGLEAPIVFLPETTMKAGAKGSPLLETQDGGFLWCGSKGADCEGSAAARALRAEKEADETLRLLYVALTRARDRLVLCGRIDARTKDESVGGWYKGLCEAFEHPSIAPGVREVDGFKRFGPDPRPLGRAAARAVERAPLPAWAGEDARADPAALKYASPSQMAETIRGPAPSPLAQTGGLGRFRRGDIVHRLLQLLPDIAPAERQAAAERLLAKEPGLSDEQRTEMIAAAFGVLDDPRFAEVFGPGSRAEATIAGTAKALPAGLAVSGRVDRLLVTPERVLVVDYKTNRPAPASIEEADEAYRIQMAVYAAVLREVFPDRAVEAALVWTDGPKLMAVPEKVMIEALARLS
ncbi:MAG TPA: double-strand break repair helicase AddA [Caulobacteraceae bacterium]